jgi:hypothetical protein
MKIFYVGHPAHVWSASTVFLETALARLGDLHIFRPNIFDVPEILQQGLDGDFDVHVFFQFDFMAYPFMAAGKKVLIIPMVDGSATYGLDHWKTLTGATFLSFSKTFSKYLRKYSNSVFETQYFPEPQRYIEPTEASVYFWPREENFEPFLVKAVQFLPKDIKVLSIRLDSGKAITSRTRTIIENTLDIEILNIPSKEAHLDQVRRASGVLASRKAEGIGHSFLEAMALGRFVVAANYPTMSEYIKSGHNGFLTKTSRKPGQLSPMQLGINAHMTVTEGRQRYLSFESTLGNILENVPNSVTLPRGSVSQSFDAAIAIYRGLSFPKGFGVNLDLYIRMFGR